MIAPTKKSRIIELASTTNLTSREIAQRVGSTVASVSTVIWRERKHPSHGRRMIRGPVRRPLAPDETARVITLRIPVDTYVVLAAAADERLLGLASLCAAILDVIAQDGLVRAVLED